MTQRVSLSILLCTLAALTAQAQWSKQDSLRLQQLLNGEEELIINKEAVKSIHFDFKPTKGCHPRKSDDISRQTMDEISRCLTQKLWRYHPMDKTPICSLYPLHPLYKMG